MHQKPKVLIVGGFTFSRGEAGSNYVIGFGKAVEGAGFCAEFLAQDSPGEKVRDDFQDFKCHFVDPGPALRGWRSALVNLSAWRNNLLEWLAKKPASEFHAVIVYPGGDFNLVALEKLRRLCRNKGWRHAVIVGEWQDFETFSMLKLHHRFLAILDSELQRRVQYKKVHNVIAISRFLERYYQSSVCHAIYVPPLIDASAKKWDCRPSLNGEKRELKLLFSGGWWRDRLDLVIEAVGQLRREGHGVVLEFLGSSAKDLMREPVFKQQMAKVPEGTVRFHGKVPVEKVLPITASADFGVLLRERAKWSDACFPSKLAEFQRLGVPMLCNLTSNLGEVLRDGQNALIVPQLSSSSFATTVKRALALGSDEILRMKASSTKCAAEFFDYRVHTGSLARFLQ